MWLHHVERDVLDGYLIENGASLAEADGRRRIPPMRRECFGDVVFTATRGRQPRSLDVAALGTVDDAVTAWIEAPVERPLLGCRIVSAAQAVGWSL